MSMSELPDVIDRGHAEKIAEAFQFECEKRYNIEVHIGKLGQAVAGPMDYWDLQKAKNVADAHNLEVEDEYGTEDGLRLEVKPAADVR